MTPINLFEELIMKKKLLPELILVVLTSVFIYAQSSQANGVNVEAGTSVYEYTCTSGSGRVLQGLVAAGNRDHARGNCRELGGIYHDAPALGG